MAILVKCGSCNKPFRAKNSAEGKKTKCPKCGESIVIEGDRVPDNDVFISHSSQDANAANQVLHTLEENKIRCWIAPRDIKGGANWSSSIVEAIGNSRVMVLIYSENSNLSPQVLREVERAVAKQVVIVPFRIDETPMSSDLEYFLSSSHWLDALNGPSEEELQQLVKSIKSISASGGSAAVSSTSLPGAPRQKSDSSQRTWLIGLVSLVVSLVVLGIVLTGNRGKGDPREQPRNVQSGAGSTPEASEAEPMLFDPGFRRETDRLTKLIQDNVSPDEWNNPKTADHDLMFFDSLLLVSATERTHRKLEEFLNELRQAKGLPVKQSFTGVSPDVRQTLERLSLSQKIQFIDTPMYEVVEHMRDTTSIPFHLNAESLEFDGLNEYEPVTYRAETNENVSIRILLDDMLKEIDPDLTWHVMDGGAVQISMRDDVRWGMPIRVYDVADLLGQTHDAVEPVWMLEERLAEFIRISIMPESWIDLGGYGTLSGVDRAMSMKHLTHVHRKVTRLFEEMRRIRNLEAPENWVTLSENEKRVEKILELVSNLEFIDAPLNDSLEYISLAYDVNLRINENALLELSLSTDIPITMIHQGIRLSDSLELFCGKIDPEAIFEFTDGFFVLTTQSAIEKRAESRFYRIPDLLEPHPDGDPAVQQTYLESHREEKEQLRRDLEKWKAEMRPKNKSNPDDSK